MAVTDAELLAYNETIIEMLKERFQWMETQAGNIRGVKKIEGASKLFIDSPITHTKDKFTPARYVDALLFWGKHLRREKKSNRRAIAAFLQNLPEDNLTVLREILDGKLDARDIASYMKDKQGQAVRLGGFGHNYDPGFTPGDKFAGKVGHAETGLNLIPDVMQEWLQPFEGPNATKMRFKFLRLAKKKGYNLGDNFLNFIDPGAHKPFDKILTGILSERYGVNPENIPEDIYTRIKQNQAHAALFGKETGRPVPLGIEGIKGLKPDQFLKAIEPWLQLPRMTNENANVLNAVLENTRNLPEEDFAKAIQNLPKLEDNKQLTELNERLKLLAGNRNLKGDVASGKQQLIKGRLRYTPETGGVTASSDLLKGPVQPDDIRLYEKAGHLLSDTQADILAFAGKNRTGAKIFKALPFVSVGAGLVLTPGIVKAAEERQEENPSIANWTQLQLERISHRANQASAAAIVPTVVPEPNSTAAGLATIAVAETVDAFASGGSLFIDAARFIKNNPDKIQEFWTDVKPRLPLHTKEGEEDYDQRAKDYADQGGWDVSGYTF